SSRRRGRASSTSRTCKRSLARRRARSSARTSASCSTARSCCTTRRRCATTRSASTSSRAEARLLVFEETLVVGAQLGATAGVARQVHQLVRIIVQVVPLVLLIDEVGVDVVQLVTGILAPESGTGLTAADAVVTRV